MIRPKNNTYPIPDIPVDEAWAAMNKMLDADKPNPPAAPKGPRRFWVYCAVTLMLTGIIFWTHQNVKQLNESVSGKNRVNPYHTTNPVKKVDSENRKSESEHIASENNEVATLHGDTSNEPSMEFESRATSMDDITQNNTQQVQTENNIPIQNSHIPVQPENKVNRMNSISATAADRESNGIPKENRIPITVKNSDQSTRSKHIPLQPANSLTSMSMGRSTTEIERQRLNLIKEDILQPGQLDNQSGTASNMLPQEDTATWTNNNQTAFLTWEMSVINNDESTLGVVPETEAIMESASGDSVVGQSEMIKRTKRKGILSQFNAGLQWNIPLPIQGRLEYSSNTGFGSKPYALLIPEIGIAKSFGKNKNHTLQLLLNPNQQYFTGKKEIASNNGRLSALDSTSVNRITQLSKIYGVGTTLQYTYQFGSRWNVGMGLNQIRNGNALLSKRTIRVSDGQLLYDSLQSAGAAYPDLRNITKGWVSGKLEFTYAFKKLQSGAALYIPLSNLSTYPNRHIKPVNGQLFLRWNIK